MAIPGDGIFSAYRYAVYIGLCGILFAICGDKRLDQARVPTGQVVAHVGTDDITRQELEDEFRSSGVPNEMRNDDATVRRVFNELVVRKYLARQALSAHLDQAQTVVLDIQRSRERTLANDLLQRDTLRKMSGTGDGDIFRYIDSHPLKFAKREFMTIEQVNLPLSAYSQSVVDATNDLKSIEEVDRALTGMGVVHTRSAGLLNSGDIPEELFNVLQAKRAGNVFFVKMGAKGAFFEVKNEEASPVVGEASVQLARQLVKAEAIRDELHNAAIAANAEAKFEGKYARIMEHTADTAEGSVPGVIVPPSRDPFSSSLPKLEGAP
jgi:EpsD family peptidyl-prolyl cis-trans isomerase